MILEPTCTKRGCIHFTGIVQPDGTEKSEAPACKAFPKGIPSEIAYGKNPHASVQKGQTGDFVFTKGHDDDEGEEAEKSLTAVETGTFDDLEGHDGELLLIIKE